MNNKNTEQNRTPKSLSTAQSLDSFAVLHGMESVPDAPKPVGPGARRLKIRSGIKPASFSPPVIADASAYAAVDHAAMDSFEPSQAPQDAYFGDPLSPNPFIPTAAHALGQPDSNNGAPDEVLPFNDSVFAAIFDDTQNAPADRKNRPTRGELAQQTSAPSVARPIASTSWAGRATASSAWPDVQEPDIIAASEPQAIVESDTRVGGDKAQGGTNDMAAAHKLTPEHTAQGPGSFLPAGSALPRQGATQSSLTGLITGFWRVLNSWVDSAAGYDEKILESFGTPTDNKRRRNIGRAIVVATLVGSLGWLVKVSLSMPAPYGVMVGLIIAGLYGVLSYSLESFFAANVNPFAPLWSKALSLLGRSLLSALIAFSGALPWVTMSLKGPIQLEMAKLTQSEQLAFRSGIDKVHGLSALGARSAELQSELAQWNAALIGLPAPLVAGLAQADQCSAEFDVLRQDAPKKESVLTSRLGALSKLESSAKGDDRKIASINIERRTLAKRMAELSKSLSDKKSQCSELRTSADSARDEHVKMASGQRQSAMSRLAEQRQTEQIQSAAAQRDTAQADKVTKLALSENSAGEFTALINLLRTQFYAQALAGLIFLGLFMVDVLPLTLRLFARPGPYDGEKRSDDDIRMMRAEGRLMQAELIHAARRAEITSDEFRAQVQKEVRPHIRSMALNEVSRFVAKQRNSA